MHINLATLNDLRKMMRVDIWSDVVCPFCYIGKKRLELAAQQAGIVLEIHWHSFQLDPEAAHSPQVLSNVERLAQKYGRSISEIEEMQVNIAGMAQDVGIQFNWEKIISGNTFDAHRLIHFAQSKGLGNDIQEAMFYSIMTEGLAIDSRETLEDVAARVGLNPVEVDDVLDSDQYADFVKFDQDVARDQLKVTGVPFFVFKQRVALAGAQPIEVFLEVLEKAQALEDPEQDADAAEEVKD